MILPFLLLGTASVSAQVRIGGSGTPHNAAVLDLNVNDDATPSGNRGGLALPRVVLTAYNVQLNDADPVNGMLVYHTGSSLDGAGVYIWMTDKWVKASTGHTGSTSIALDGDSLVRKALTGDVTADENRNETTIGNGTVTSAKILDNTITANDIADGAIGQAAIADGAIVNSKLANASVDSRSLGSMGATAGQLLGYGSSGWAPVSPPQPAPTNVMVVYNLYRPKLGSFDLSSCGLCIPLTCTAADQSTFKLPLAIVASGAIIAADGSTICAADGSTICAANANCRCFVGSY